VRIVKMVSEAETRKIRPTQDSPIVRAIFFTAVLRWPCLLLFAWSWWTEPFLIVSLCRGPFCVAACPARSPSHASACFVSPALAERCFFSKGALHSKSSIDF